MPSYRNAPAVVLVVVLCSGPLVIAQEQLWREHANEGRKAHDPGNYAEAERLLRLALSEVERLGKDDARTADALDDLACLLIDLPTFFEAESLVRRKRGPEPSFTSGKCRCIVCACQDHDVPPKAA